MHICVCVYHTHSEILSNYKIEKKGEGHGNPLQYSYLENPTDRGAWQATVPEVATSPTQLSN